MKQWKIITNIEKFAGCENGFLFCKDKTGEGRF